jgi:hypothetical protein
MSDSDNKFVIEVKPFTDEVLKASSDCWIKSDGERNNTKTHAIPLDRIIEIAFHHQIKTYDSWHYNDPEVTLERKLFLAGAKKAPKSPRYNTEKELYQKLCDFNHYKTLSGSEKKVFDALIKLSPNYRWDMYLALHKLIDGFLF